MSDQPTASTPEFKFVECKFTVESDSCVGGDWERNTGGAHERKRISFDGYASSEVCAALIGAINKVVGA